MASPSSSSVSSFPLSYSSSDLSFFSSSWVRLSPSAVLSGHSLPSVSSSCSLADLSDPDLVRFLFSILPYRPVDSPEFRSKFGYSLDRLRSVAVSSVPSWPLFASHLADHYLDLGTLNFASLPGLENDQISSLGSALVSSLSSSLPLPLNCLPAESCFLDSSLVPSSLVSCSPSATFQVSRLPEFSTSFDEFLSSVDDSPAQPVKSASWMPSNAMKSIANSQPPRAAPQRPAPSTIGIPSSLSRYSRPLPSSLSVSASSSASRGVKLLALSDSAFLSDPQKVKAAFAAEQKEKREQEKRRLIEEKNKEKDMKKEEKNKEKATKEEEKTNKKRKNESEIKQQKKRKTENEAEDKKADKEPKEEQAQQQSSESQPAAAEPDRPAQPQSAAADAAAASAVPSAPPSLSPSASADSGVDKYLTPSNRLQPRERAFLERFIRASQSADLRSSFQWDNEFIPSADGKIEILLNEEETETPECKTREMIVIELNCAAITWKKIRRKQKIPKNAANGGNQM